MVSSKPCTGSSEHSDPSQTTSPSQHSNDAPEPPHSPHSSTMLPSQSHALSAISSQPHS